MGKGFIVTVEYQDCDTNDYIPVMFSERLVSPEKIKENLYLIIEGQFRSYNNYDSTKGHKLMLTVFARELEIYENEEEVKVKTRIR